jgi:hypothetical protein
MKNSLKLLVGFMCYFGIAISLVAGGIMSLVLGIQLMVMFAFWTTDMIVAFNWLFCLRAAIAISIVISVSSAMSDFKGIKSDVEKTVKAIWK